MGDSYPFNDNKYVQLQMQQKEQKPASAVGSQRVLAKVRKVALARGNRGIADFGRAFKIYDDDCDRKLSPKELRDGLNDYGCGLTAAEHTIICEAFDTDGDGTVNFDEFLMAMRPPMAKCRLDMIEKAFVACDKTGDGVITIDDLKKKYKVDCHPKYKSGEYTKDQVLKEYLNTFQPGCNPDDRVTKTEFINYYAAVSASIDKDVYFDYMMRQAWKLKD